MEENRSYGMLVVAALVALGAVGIALITTNNTTSNEPGSGAVAVAEKTGSVSGDADEDGVPDWKEVLWGTDPHNPDSDGDGVSDGQEIETGADPLREGSTPAALTYSAPKALSPTEALSRELFVGYASAIQDGSLGSGEANAAALGALSTNVSSLTAAKEYTIADLKVASDIPVDVYEPALNRALKKTLAVREYELTTFARAVADEDFSALEPLVAATTVYAEVTNDLVNMNVPSSVAVQHLAFVNNFSALAHATALLTTWNGDPLDGLNLVNNFAKAEKDFGNAVSLLYAIIDNER